VAVTFLRKLYKVLQHFPAVVTLVNIQWGPLMRQTVHSLAVEAVHHTCKCSVIQEFQLNWIS